MSNLTREQVIALTTVMAAVLEAVEAAGNQGAPGGVIYAGLMAQGASYSQYQSLMIGMVKKGNLTQDEDLYYITEAGKSTKVKLQENLVKLKHVAPILHGSQIKQASMQPA